MGLVTLHTLAERDGGVGAGVGRVGVVVLAVDHTLELVRL